MRPIPYSLIFSGNANLFEQNLITYQQGKMQGKIKIIDI